MSDTPCPFTPCPEVQLVKNTVLGNGHPEASLVVRVCVIEKQIATIKRLSFATLCGVGGLVSKALWAWLEAAIHTGGTP